MTRTSRILIFLSAILCPFICNGHEETDSISIEECMRLARENYPQIKQLNLIDEASKYDISGAMKSWLPRLNISGKATYQSDVVEMPFDIPGFSFNLPHDQYSLVGEISQTIWDGGTTRSQKEIYSTGAEVQKKQVEVSVYSINDRVAKIYLGILLIDGQLMQNDILEESLKRNARQVQARIDNGTAYKSDLDMIRVQMLNCEQQEEGLLTDREAYVRMLEKLTGTSLGDKKLSIPVDDAATSSSTVTRPELLLYDAQMQQNEAQLRQLNSKISPKFSLSIQGGIGRPGLNILENSFLHGRHQNVMGHRGALHEKIRETEARHPAQDHRIRQGDIPAEHEPERHPDAGRNRQGEGTDRQGQGNHQSSGIHKGSRGGTVPQRDHLHVGPDGQDKRRIQCQGD